MQVSHPTENVGRSVSFHNSDITVVADWIEALVLFFEEQGGDGISVPDCVDYLIEEQIYDDQDYCTEFIGSVFAEIRFRASTCDRYPIVIDDNRTVRSVAEWREHPALAFCIVVSLLPFYSGYSTWVDGDYNEQGLLFEKITEAALRSWFPQWEVFRTGWAARDGTSIADLLNLIAERTVEVVRSEAPSILTGDEKDLGMDIAAVRTFPDGRPSLPVIFGQCASGRNWPDKLPTPDASRWKQFLTLTHTPLRAFSLPFRLLGPDYESRRSQFKGLLMDRSRLIPGEGEDSWLDDDTRVEIAAFVDERLVWLADTYRHE